MPSSANKPGVQGRYHGDGPQHKNASGFGTLHQKLEKTRFTRKLRSSMSPRTFNRQSGRSTVLLTRQRMLVRLDSIAGAPKAFRTSENTSPDDGKGNKDTQQHDRNISDSTIALVVRRCSSQWKVVPRLERNRHECEFITTTPHPCVRALLTGPLVRRALNPGDAIQGGHRTNSTRHVF